MAFNTRKGLNVSNTQSIWSITKHTTYVSTILHYIPLQLVFWT